MSKDEDKNDSNLYGASEKDQNLVGTGYIKETKVFLIKGDFMDLYENNFFGEPKNDNLILDPEEASLLIERGRIDVYTNETLEKKLTLSDYITSISKVYPDFWERYLVYKDLRSRGYVVRAGYGGGTLVPYRRYPRGARPNKAQSDTFVYPLPEGSSIEPHEFDLIVNQAQSNRKVLILGIVDRSGDVTYYKASEFQIPINSEKFEM